MKQSNQKETQPMHDRIIELRPIQVRIEDAAKMLAMHPSTVRRLVQRGELTAIGRGRLRRIAVKDLEAWQERNREER